MATRSPTADPTDSIDGLVVAITGAGSGIGAALAACFAAEGAKVSGCDIGANAAVLATEHAADVDVTDPAAVTAWIDAIVDEFGRLDAVIANAGLALVGSFEDVPAAKLERVLDVNINGVLHTFRASLPHLRATAAAGGVGRMVGLVSRNAEICPANLLSYNASKAAVIASIRSLSREWKGTGVLVNGLIPGPILSPMNPAGQRTADSCYPTARLLCTLPADGPSGRAFFDGEDYPIWSGFATPRREPVVP